MAENHEELDLPAATRTAVLTDAIARERLLGELARDLAGAITDVDAVIATTVRRAAMAIGDFCSVRLVSADGVWFENPSFADRDPEAEAFYGALLDVSWQRVDEGVSGQVMQSGEPLLLPVVDPVLMRAQFSPWATAILDRYDVHSLMIVPLQARGESIGVIGLARREPDRPYLEGDLAFLTAIAAHAASALTAARLHEQLATSEAQYRTLVENETDLIGRVDRDHRVIFVNRAWQDSLGHPSAEPFGPTASGHDLPPGLTREAIDDALAGAPDVLLDAATAEGETWYETHCIPERDAGGLVRSVLVRSRDVTERKRAEEEVRASVQDYRAAVADLDASRSQLRSALEIGRMGVWTWEIETDVAVADDTLLGLVGLEPEEGDGEGEPDTSSAQVLAFVHPDDLPAALEAVDRLRLGGGAIEMITRVIHEDGDVRWLWWKGSAEVDDRGRPVRVTNVVRDITEERRADAARTRSQRLEALGTLAGGIAHDFNNVLAAIVGLTGLAQHDLAPDHPVQEDLAGIAAAASRASDLVRRVLSFSRQQEPDRENIRLQPLLEETLDLLRATSPATVTITADFAPDVPVVSADASQICQVALNLVTNATHAIGPSGGSVGVRLGQVDLDIDEVDDLAAGRYATITVTDDGCGMTAEVIGRVFDPFFTTKQPGQGTGLGLSVVDGIVRTHHGGTTVESEPGQGTTVTVYLPASSEPAAAVPPAPTAHRSSGHRVLYVDDEPVLVELATRQLSLLGYEVTGFVDPIAALREVRTDPDRFDVVVTDLTMPGMSGVELAREIRGIRAGLPIVMLSGHVERADPSGVARLDVDLSLPKPCSLEELGVALGDLLEDARQVPPGA